MKIFRIISFGIYGIGFILKLLHFIGGSTLMALGVFLSLIAVLLTFIIKKKDTGKPERSFIALGILFLFIYFYVRVQFLPGLTIFMLLTAAVCFIPIILFIKNKEKIRPAFIMLVSLFILAEVSYFTPYSTVYYIVNLSNLPLASEVKDHTREWDRYSWQLYWEGKYDKALLANDNALEAVHLNMVNDSIQGNSTYFKMDQANLKYINQHRQAIQNKNWNSLE